MIKMKLESKTTALVAVGASTAANCTGCLEKTLNMAKEAGADQEEIGEAVEIGRRKGRSSVKTRSVRCNPKQYSRPLFACQE